MSYENPTQPEDINVSDDSPLTEFFSLLVVLGLVVAGSVVALSLSAQWLARYIPFSYEVELVSAVGEPLLERLNTPDSAEELNRERYLKGLAERLAPHLNLADDIDVTLHYDTGDVKNAFATLGGHVVIYRGLLDELPSENAVAMVVAHEMAHIKLRHPIVAMSRGASIALAITAIFGFTDNALGTQIINWFGVTSSLSFNRAQERAADELAADALLAEYGHLEGATDLFERMAEDRTRAETLLFPEFQATHPAVERRIETLEERIEELGVTGSVTPLPWDAGTIGTSGL